MWTLFSWKNSIGRKQIRRWRRLFKARERRPYDDVPIKKNNNARLKREHNTELRLLNEYYDKQD